MQDTAGTWLMTSLTASPLLIALMQTAASLPVLVLGLLAGATADLFDRRKLLIFWQSWMLGSVAVLALLTFLGHISPWSLLAFTFLLNVGSSMNNPAWQAIIPELVPREMVPDAVSLNAASNNLARALGPALGGLMVAAFKRTDTGTAYVFLLNSVSFAAVIWVLVNWKRVPLFKSALPSERMAASIRGGLRYVRYAPNLQASLAAGRYVYVLLFGDMGAAGGGGEERSAAGRAGIWHFEWLAGAGRGGGGVQPAAGAAGDFRPTGLSGLQRFITWRRWWCWRGCICPR